MTVSIDADGITSDINQDTGVITFTADYSETPLGNYVATVTCGEAEPVEIAITATAPSIEQLTSNMAQDTIKITALNRAVNVNIIRYPNGSRGGDITCTLADYEDKFVVTHTASNSYNARYRYYYDTFSFKQTASTAATSDIDTVFACGDATKTLHLHPYN